MSAMDEAKPFCIPKRAVWEAYKRVKENHGAAGVDGQTIADFEEDLSGNLYKIWNRMCSGSYFPPPVLRVEIPKDNGAGVRPLGIPTVSDRIAQTVGKNYLEPILEEIFDEDSYGYRPGRSARDAIGMARTRCWRHDWVLELDIRSFFDNLDHGLLLRAVRHHTDCEWVLLYVERWLKASVQLEDGSTVMRDKGTPQGGVVSPLLSNLFLHYVFDRWMRKHFPDIPFERYADDAVCHCKTLVQAQQLRAALEQRFAECHLELHAQKTRVVYCKDDDRRGTYPDHSFDFLGFTFRPRRSKNRWGKFFISFTPAVSNKAAKAMRRTMRSWGLHNRSDKSIEDLAGMFNPVAQGWINYYGRFYKSALYPTLRHLDLVLARWAAKKYKKLRGHLRRARHWLARVAQTRPGLFAHWKLVQPTVG
ncbi:group II intron reverse transcriptase/maturase [Caballeronia sp. LjRoot34]